MRCKWIVIALALAAGCTKTDMTAPCHPATSWAAPAFRCAAPPAPAPVVAIPEPKPEPPPEPPKKAVLKADKIEVNEIVEFETASAKLKPESEKILDEVAQILQDHADVTKVEVQGYTDNQGSRGYNMTLSTKRAATVKTYLIGKGIAKDRLTSKGYGPDNPVADNGTDDGRHQNRRVDFKILSRKDQ